MRHPIFQLPVKFIFSGLITLVFFSCNEHPAPPAISEKEKPLPEAVATLNYSVVTSYPHDTSSFTEGFVFHDKELYESTGATGNLPQTRSLFGVVDLKTGKINKKAELDREKYFGEGIVFLDGKVYQLTYTTNIGFIYDATTFRKLREFTFQNKEGWGFTTDGKQLIMSDGTNALTYLDPNTLQPVKSVEVSENGYAVDFLNELEYIHGAIYANIWRTNTIVKIDPQSGRVTAKLDLTALAEDARIKYSGSQEMNGIAYDSLNDQILVTGKMWPKIYEIKFVH